MHRFFVSFRTQQFYVPPYPSVCVACVRLLTMGRHTICTHGEMRRRQDSSMYRARCAGVKTPARRAEQISPGHEPWVKSRQQPSPVRGVKTPARRAEQISPGREPWVKSRQQPSPVRSGKTPARRAEQISPGREPWVKSRQQPSPVRGGTTNETPHPRYR